MPRDSRDPGTAPRRSGRLDRDIRRILPILGRGTPRFLIYLYPAERRSDPAELAYGSMRSVPAGLAPLAGRRVFRQSTELCAPAQERIRGMSSRRLEEVRRLTHRLSRGPS